MVTTTDEVKKMFRLVSSDGEEFEIEEAVAKQSQTIGKMMEEDCEINKFPCPNVQGKVMAKVMEYCKKHAKSSSDSQPEDRINGDELKSWDAEFIKVDRAMLYGLILDLNKGKSPEEIRALFNIKNDFTPEEKEEVRGETQWAFELST